MKRKTLGWFLVLGGVYFALMIAPTLTGARDWNMLSIFEKDEFAQHNHVISMLTPGETLFETVRRFVVYQHYFYGYPFYLLSALMLLPYRLIAGAGWAENPQVVMAILRQMVSVLPMIVAIGLMTRLQTRGKPRGQAAALFIFLFAVPAVVQNNFWWHPDSLALLLVVLVFFFIQRDEFAFGRDFYLAAATCGVAFSVKYAGAFFVLAIPTYIVWGVARGALSWRRGVGAALAFLGAMLAGLVLSNPLLLIPQTRQDILDIARQQWVQTRVGYYTRNPDWNLTREKLNAVVWPLYGEWFAWLLMALGLYRGVRSPRHRLLNGMILAYLTPYLLTVGTSSIRPLYFLPVVIPLGSALVHLFDPVEGGARLNLISLLQGGALVLLVAQFGLYLRQDARIYTEVLYREANSPGIAFFRQVEARLDELGLSDQPLVIYRDPTAYVTPRPNYDVRMNWRLASYDYLNRTQPDVLLLEMDYIREFTRPGAVESAVDPDDMQAWQDFYGDAAADRLAGYVIFYQNEYGVALIRETLLQKTN